MAALPASRVQTHLPAFTHVTLDYFGPLNVVQFRRTVRRYGLLFVDNESRAVHIEIPHSLDTDSFLMAFWRFADRRGFPAHCYSDQGTSFIAGEKEIKKLINELDQTVIADALSRRGIQWHFNPPASPHFGGSW